MDSTIWVYIPKIYQEQAVSKKVEKVRFREGSGLVWKVMPDPVASFGEYSRSPCGHMEQKSENFEGMGGSAARKPMKSYENPS